MKNLEEQIADLHLAQFELSQQRDQLFQKTQYLDNLIASSSEPIPPARFPFPGRQPPTTTDWVRRCLIFSQVCARWPG